MANEILDNNEYEEEDIITLTSPDGEEIDFIEVAGIEHNDGFYLILQPVELLEGMEEDEALVFKVTEMENGEEKFEIELDEEIITAVFKEYDRLYDEAQNSAGK